MSLTTLISFMFFSGVIVASAWDMDNKESVKDYIIYVAQREQVNVGMALKVAQCESGFNRNALNHTAKERSVGVFQINLKAHTDITEEQARNPFWNINWAIDRLKEGLWHWWTCAKLV